MPDELLDFLFAAYWKLVVWYNTWWGWLLTLLIIVVAACAPVWWRSRPHKPQPRRKSH